jgi:hypothetical protein
MCKELERLILEEENAVRQCEQALDLLAGAMPNHGSALQARVDAALQERIAAPERVERQKAEHGCG